ncbi:hypothetical protein TNCV_3820441 [Trichonephila clavipes]|nr:hypothetical protein TNCV_3820441 [Trichonephila clavipes]
MLATPYAALFQLQGSSSPDKLCDFWHSPAFKERNRQWLQHKVRHGVFGSHQKPHCIPFSRQIAIPYDMQVSMSTYTDIIKPPSL